MREVLLCAKLLLAAALSAQVNEAFDHWRAAFVSAEVETLIDETSSMLSPQISVTQGYVNDEFDDVVDIAVPLRPSQLRFVSGSLKPVQYTISDVEGVIKIRGRFIGQEFLDLNRLPDGQYAIYFFVGKEVMRALLVDFVRERPADF